MPNAPVISNDSQWKSRDRPVDPAVADLAHRQHGVVSRAQLVAAGVGVGAIEWRLARQRLHRVHAGVYAVGHGVLTSEGRLMAAVLAGGRDAALSHRAAAAHWGIRQSQARDMDVTTPRKLRCRPGLRFHEAHLPKDEVTTRDRIPVTTVPRTLFDLAGEVPHHQLERAVNEAEIRHLWDPLCLADLLARYPRRPGAAAIRSLIAEPVEGVTRNDLEGHFSDLIKRARLPRPARNARMQLGARWIEPDCVWREQRLIVELDGRATHATRAAFENDRARDRALAVAGWRVIRVTWRQLQDQPEALAADLRTMLTTGPSRDFH